MGLEGNFKFFLYLYYIKIYFLIELMHRLSDFMWLFNLTYSIKTMIIIISYISIIITY